MNNLDNAQIELKHIQLELQNGRTRHFRHFIDQYYCYKKGYVTRNGRAKWSEILRKETISIEAKKITDRCDLIKEHVIPLKYITRKLHLLAESGTIELNDISSCIDEMLFFATITKSENLQLDDAKLKSKMPESYNTKGHNLYKDPFARYKTVGITYERKP